MSTPNVPPDPVSNKKKGCSILWTLAILVGVLLVGAAVMAPKSAYVVCRSKRAAPQTALVNLYIAEKAFFDEHGVYTTDLVALGWHPDGSEDYAYGFATPSSVAEIQGVVGHDPARRTTLDPRVVAMGGFTNEVFGAKRSEPLSAAEFDAVMPAASATSSGFVAIAVGNIDLDRLLDVWSIDHNKTLEARRNDCSGTVNDGSDGKT